MQAESSYPESRKWFLLALGLIFVWLVWKLSPIVTPFALSATLAYLFDPLADRLQKVRLGKWQWSRTVAVTIVFVLMIGMFVTLLLVIVPLLKTQVERLVDRIPQIIQWLESTAWPWIQGALSVPDLSLDTAAIAENFKSHWRETSSALFSVIGTLSQGGQAFLAFLMNLLLVPVVTFYLLRDWDKLVGGIRMMLPRRLEPTVSSLAGEIDDVLGAFIRGQLIVMLALGVIYSFGLWAIGLDLAFVIGLSAGLLSIVPYLGTVLGVAAGLVAAFFQFQDVPHVVMVLVVFGIGQALEGMVLTPKLVGDRIGLHPVAVIFAVLAGGQLAGFLGVLLALPVAAALNVLVLHIHAEYRNSRFYGEEPFADPQPQDGHSP